MTIFVINQWIDQLKKQLQCKFVRPLTFVIFFVILINANTRVVAQELMQKGIDEFCVKSSSQCYIIETPIINHEKTVHFFDNNIALVEFDKRYNLTAIKKELEQAPLTKKDQRQFIRLITKRLSEESLKQYARPITRLQNTNAINSLKPLPISNGLVIKFKPQHKTAIENFFQQELTNPHLEKPSSPSRRTTDTLALESKLDDQLQVTNQLSHDNSHALEAVSLVSEQQQLTSVTIALVDSGVSNHHQELSHLTRLQQYNPKHQTMETKDTGFGHGTGVFSLMASSNQHDMVIGSLPNANYLSCNGLPSGGYNYLWVTSCFDWLLQNDVDIIVNSWLQPTMNCNSELLYSLRILWLANSIPVFAAGNFGEGKPTTRDPAHFQLFDGVPLISVGATDDKEQPLPQSSYGTKQCEGLVSVPTLSAPGSNLKVASPLQENSYQRISGTSYAVTYVATVLAVLINEFPNKTNQELVHALISGARQPKSTSRKAQLGQGIADLETTIKILKGLHRADSQNQ